MTQTPRPRPCHFRHRHERFFACFPRFVIVAVLAFWCLVGAAATVHAQRKTALLIALRYDGAVLPGSENDVCAVAQILEYRYGFRRGDITIVGIKRGTVALGVPLTGYTFGNADANRSDVLREMRKLADANKAGDAAVLYITGHGDNVNNPEATLGTTQFLITADRLPVFDYEIDRQTASAGGRLTFLIDTCASGGVARSPGGIYRYALPKTGGNLLDNNTVSAMLRQTMPASLPRSPLTYATGDKRVVFAACADTERAYQITYPHNGKDPYLGLFTATLYKILITRREPISNGQLRTLLTQSLREQTLVDLKTKTSFFQVPMFHGGNVGDPAIAPGLSPLPPYRSGTQFRGGYLSGTRTGSYVTDNNEQFFCVKKAGFFEGTLKAVSAREAKTRRAGGIKPYKKPPPRAIRRGIAPVTPVFDGYDTDSPTPARRVFLEQSPDGRTTNVVMENDPGTASAQRFVLTGDRTKEQAEAGAERLQETWYETQHFLDQIYAPYEAKGAPAFRLQAFPADTVLHVKDPLRIEWDTAGRAGYALLLNVEQNGDLSVIAADSSQSEVGRATRRTYAMRATEPIGECTVLAFFRDTPWVVPDELGKVLQKHKGRVPVSEYEALFNFMVAGYTPGKGAYRELRFMVEN